VREVILGVLRRVGLAVLRRLGAPVVSPSTGRYVHGARTLAPPDRYHTLKSWPEDDAAARDFQRIGRAARLQALRDFDHARGLPRQGVLLRRLDGVRVGRAARIAWDISEYLSNEES
jgi:hypothetical protein